jgi:hypothetical protein
MMMLLLYLSDDEIAAHLSCQLLNSSCNHRRSLAQRVLCVREEMHHRGKCAGSDQIIENWFAQPVRGRIRERNQSDEPLLIYFITMQPAKFKIIENNDAR